MPPVAGPAAPGCLPAMRVVPSLAPVVGCKGACSRPTHLLVSTRCTPPQLPPLPAPQVPTLSRSPLPPPHRLLPTPPPCHCTSLPFPNPAATTPLPFPNPASTTLLRLLRLLRLLPQAWRRSWDWGSTWSCTSTSLSSTTTAPAAPAAAGLAEELGLGEHVEFCVNVPFSQLLALLGDAVAGLHSMVDEHFGISVVEYMAAGEAHAPVPVHACMGALVHAYAFMHRRSMCMRSGALHAGPYFWCPSLGWLGMRGRLGSRVRLLCR